VRQENEASIVAVAQVGSDVGAAVREAMEAAELRRFVPRGARVAVKPNLGWDLFIPGSITSPLVLAAVLDQLEGHAGERVVVEADQVLEDVESVFRRCFEPLCRARGVSYVNMSHGPRRTVGLEGAHVLHQASLPQVLEDACLVTVPVMKTHDKTALSGAIKNQWGCLPETRHHYHLVVDEALVDILRLTRPAFAVLDATVALEGNGPKTGRPKLMNLVLASGDPVALDAVQAFLMGLEPGEVEHVRLCGEAGLGEHRLDKIILRGPALEPLRQSFKRAGHNFVSQVELALRRSPLRRVVFHTPLFDLMAVGAKAWYHAWNLLGPRRRLWREMMLHPIYGAQWQCAQKS
jgi:uncharacterized protein (DUF362 family)